MVIGILFDTKLKSDFYTTVVIISVMICLSERLPQSPSITDIQVVVIGTHMQCSIFNFLHDGCDDDSTRSSCCTCVVCCGVVGVCSSTPLLAHLQVVDIFEAEEATNSSISKGS